MKVPRNQDPRPDQGRIPRSASVATAVALMVAACLGAPAQIQPMRPPGPGFCALPDSTLEEYLIAVNVPGSGSSRGVATIHDGRLYVLTNRHNLPPEPDLDMVELRNKSYASTVATALIAEGRDFGEERYLGFARDYAVLTVRDPDLFAPLPMFSGRYQGPVVAPSYASRRYQVGRGQQWHRSDLFDELDFSLDIGASGAPVITCSGEIAGLYTAFILEKDWAQAGFRSLSTPIGRVRAALGP